MKIAHTIPFGFLLTILATQAFAAPVTWTGNIDDDWFTSGNWNPLAVPGAADQATIANGDTVNAGASISVDDLNVGLRSVASFGAPHGNGTLNVSDAFILTLGDMRVGVTDTGIIIGTPPPGHSNGTVVTTGGAANDGDVSIGGDLSIGHFVFGPAGIASGSVDIQDGALTGFNGTVRVGVTETIGSADGSLSVQGSVLGFEDFFIGRVLTGASGDATGTFTILNGDINSDGTSGPLVGISSGSGKADGKASVSGDALNMEGALVGGAFSSGDATGELTVGGAFQNTGTINNFNIGYASNSGKADGKMSVGAGITDVSDVVNVGRATDTATAAATAKGELEVLAGGVHGSDFNGSEFNVGKTDGAGTATGNATITGGISGLDNYNFGVVDSGASGNATGYASILSGGIAGLGTGGLLAVGTTAGSGTAMGDVTVVGSVTGMEDFSIGRVRSGASGDADGKFAITGGDWYSDGTSGPIVGNSSGSGNATGTASVSGDAFDMEGAFVGNAFSSGDAKGELTVGGTYQNVGTLSNLWVGTVSDSGDAEGKMSVGNGVTGITNFVRVGIAEGLASAAADARGDLEVLAGGVQGTDLVGSKFDVGVTEGAGSAMGKAMVAGGIGGIADFNFGVVGTGATGDATGYASILSGGLTGLGSGTLSIGTTQGSGHAMASLSVVGSVVDLEDFSIGRVHSGASGNAKGVFSITGGDWYSDGTSGPIVGNSSGSGNADGTASVSGDALDMEGAFVGNAFSSGDAKGELTVGGTYQNVGTLSNLWVGTVSDSGDAEGKMSVGNGVTGITNFVRVGFAGGSASAAAKAAGELEVLAGGVQGTNLTDSNFYVGVTEGAGSAMGKAMVAGGITGFEDVFVGVGRDDASGDATGLLTLKDGGLTADNVAVGFATGTGAATGELDLMTNLADIHNVMLLGNGATLTLGFDGTSRGIDYGAVDTSLAILNGTLDLAFSFQPAGGIFDLIVSNSINGILGDFDFVKFRGVTLGTLATWGVVVDQGVEIYRLEFGRGNPIPEPGTLLIIVSGLAFFAASGRRRGRL